jgi:hypothetical protein
MGLVDKAVGFSNSRAEATSPSVCRKHADNTRRTRIYPNIAKAGGLQSQGVKGEAVISYRNPLTTQDLKFSGFPAG